MANPCYTSNMFARTPHRRGPAATAQALSTSKRKRGQPDSVGGVSSYFSPGQSSAYAKSPGHAAGANRAVVRDIRKVNVLDDEITSEEFGQVVSANLYSNGDLLLVRERGLCLHDDILSSYQSNSVGIPFISEEDSDEEYDEEDQERQQRMLMRLGGYVGVDMCSTRMQVREMIWY